MLIGAHVSTAGGLWKAVERGTERECRAIQIFNQSPRTWRASTYSQEEVNRFRQAMQGSEIEAVLIHAVYLVNCASAEPEIRQRSLSCLTHSLRAGSQIGARGVVLHPGSAKTGEVSEAILRAGETIAQALADTEGCELHLENTAGAGGTLGRSFEELRDLIDAAGGGDRIGVCLDSCHLFASGCDIREAAKMDSVLAHAESTIGAGRIRSLHLNDSATPLGSNRDRHANIGEGELGERGCAAFLSAAPFAELPCVLETPGASGKGPELAEVQLAAALRERGLRQRRQAERRRASAQPPP